MARLKEDGRDGPVEAVRIPALTPLATTDPSQVNVIVKILSLGLLLLLALAAPVQASTDGNTLVITLPPPSIHPPAATPQPPRPYRQARMTMDGGEALSLPVPHPVAIPAPRPAGVVGRLGICAANGVPIFRWQEGGREVVARVAQGTYLAIKSDYAGWYGVLMIDGSLGWIEQNAVRLLDYNVVREPSGAPGGAPSGQEGLGAEVLREAFKYLGVPYVWGGNGRRGLDCSGLVQNCFEHCGVRLPRRASEQARVGQPVPLTLAALQPGDRLYFAVSRPTIDHTAIYLGNGYFIDAALSRGRVGVGRLSTPLYGRHLVAARRS